MPAISLAASANFLDCGSVPYCGILVLERGDGPGNYNHAVPSVHGLWPQDKEYGTSQCVNARKNTPVLPTSCYTDSDFQQHEWTKHGNKKNSNPRLLRFH
jgi:hypothetical protein